MTDMEYRDMANEIRTLVPLLIHPKAVADLRSLADQYERGWRAISKCDPAHCRTHLLSTEVLNS